MMFEYVQFNGLCCCLLDYHHFRYTVLDKIQNWFPKNFVLRFLPQNMFGLENFLFERLIGNNTFTKHQAHEIKRPKSN